MRISTKRIENISIRTDFPLISKLFLEMILNLEGDKKEDLQYQKWYTNLYRLKKTDIVRSLNSALFQSITKTFSTSDFECDEDKKLRNELIEYWKIKNAKFAPLVFLGEQDANIQ